MMDLAASSKDDHQFNSVAEVQERYGLPRQKIKKSTGKAASCVYEAFSDNLFESKSLFNCFKTDSNRLPLWILAFSNILYGDQFTSKHNTDWNDIHDDKSNFVEIRIRVEHLLSNELLYVITVQLDYNKISVQGASYSEFILSEFPVILKSVNEMALDPLHAVSHKGDTKKREVGEKFKNKDDFNIPSQKNQQMVRT